MQYMNRNIPLSESEREAQAQDRQRRERETALRNNRLGVTVFQISWMMAFIALVIAYWQLGFTPGWQPSGDLAPNPIMPTAATLAILLSGWFARQAWHTARQTVPDSQRADPAFRQSWLIASLLGAIFFVIMLQQFFVIPYGDAPELRFGMIYRLMIGYHALHALITLIMMAQVYRLGADHRYHRDNVWAVEGTTKLWYFVIVAWLLFYAVLYAPFFFSS